MTEYINRGNKDTRSGFGDALLEIGKINKDVVALCADLSGSVKMDAFAKEFPERFFQSGIAEANMMSVAAGFATGGKIPFAGTFANFATGRVYDQLRQSIAYSQKNVKVCASHAGITLGEDGATHQIMEDIGLVKMLPGFTIVNPCDYTQTYRATFAVAKHYGPVYLRFGRPKVPDFTSKDADFIIGKAIELKKGSDVSIFATGHLVWKALEAAKILSEKNINAEIINIHTIKPIDKTAILNSVSKTGAAVSAEEHLKNGGLGDSIAQLLSENLPTPLEYVAADDCFGESGKPEELLIKYRLDTMNIVNAAIKVVGRK